MPAPNRRTEPVKRLSPGFALLLASLFIFLLVAKESPNQPAFADGPINPDLESIGVPLAGHTNPATNSWPEGRLLYGLAVEGQTTNPSSGPFWVMDLDTQQVIFTSDPSLPYEHRMILVDANGNAYFATDVDGIAKYDVANNSVAVLPGVEFPSGGWLISGTRESADGWIYGVTTAYIERVRFRSQ